MEQKIPKETTLNKWKVKYSWLKIPSLGQKKMICMVCTSQEEKLKLMPRMNLTFVTGTTNFKLSISNKHENTDGYKCAIREEENEAVAAGVDLAPCIGFKLALCISQFVKLFLNLSETAN